MNWWARYHRWRMRNVTSLALTWDGFERRDHLDTVAVRWDEVSNVTAFKRDLLAVDLLCVVFKTSSDVVEINEEMIGFAAIDDEMHRRLAIAPEWKLRVLFPAFETNAATIYDRIADVAPA